jgi:enamine deaminase RidA (YjgF/YER057c/UK114 family)
MEKVGKLTVLTTRVEHRVVIHEIRSRIFGTIGHFPASTLAVVSSLASPDWLVEIEAVALA